MSQRRQDILSQLLGLDSDYNRTEMVTDKDSVEFFIELPGVREENIDVKIDRNHAYISAKREDRRGISQFRTEFYIPSDYASDSVDANLDLGVLTLKFKRSVKPEAKKIEIKSRS